MKTLWYLIAAIVGLIGVLAVVRIVERLMTGADLMPAQLLIGLVFLLVAVIAVRQARSAR